MYYDCAPEKRHASRVIAVALLVLITTQPLLAQATPPTVEIVSPAPGATMCGTMTVSAAASDSQGIAGVRFEANAIPFGAPEDPDVPYRAFAHTNNVADGVYALTAIARNVQDEESTSAPVTVTIDNAAPYCSPKFIPTFLVYYGGGAVLVDDDKWTLAKYDLIDISRFFYDDLRDAGNNPATWATIKGINPNTKIYLYEMGPETVNFMDDEQSWPAVFLNNIARYDNARGHSMGNLNGDHQELFLLDGLGNRVYNLPYSEEQEEEYFYLMDFGSPDYRAYWVQAVQTDIANQPWVADGVHVDLCTTLNRFSPYSAVPVKYPDDATWYPAMNDFATSITAGLHGFGQKVWCNRGHTTFDDGVTAWLALDAAATPPDVVGEEGMFAVRWGDGATQFYPEESWKRQLDTLGAITNSKVAVFAHTELDPWTTGDFRDNWDRPVTFWQTLWYAMGSFLLGKQDAPNNAYFFFDYSDPTCGSYCKIRYFNEYDMLDLGKALGGYAFDVIDGKKIYWREFEQGYVYVNPTAPEVPDDPEIPEEVTVPLPPGCTSCRERTHENLYAPSSQLPVVTSIRLKSHHAAIVLKD